MVSLNTSKVTCMGCCIPIWNCFYFYIFAIGYYLQFFLLNNLPFIIQLCTTTLLLIAWSLFPRRGCGGDINWGPLWDLLHTRGCFGSSCALCCPHVCWDHLNACWHSIWIKFTSFALGMVVRLFLFASILWVRSTLSPRTTSQQMWWFWGVRRFVCIVWPPVHYTGLTTKVSPPTLRFIHHSR